MSDREDQFKIVLLVFGIVFLLVWPISRIWPAGWVWHDGEGEYYFQMIVGVYFVLGLFLIRASRNPSEHRSLIDFTVWSSVVHAAIMAIQAITDDHETGHLIGDIPALILVAVVLWYFNRPSEPAAAV